MTYRVILTSQALLELHQAALWWSDNRDAEQAARWLEGFQAAIEGLAENPQRFGLAQE